MRAREVFYPGFWELPAEIAIDPEGSALFASGSLKPPGVGSGIPPAPPVSGTFEPLEPPPANKRMLPIESVIHRSSLKDVFRAYNGGIGALIQGITSLFT